MITPAKEKALQEQMLKLGILEADILEKFIRSGGKGGQNVNKNATCVYLKHIPTGIEVKMQKERTQGMNRFFARRLLAQKIEELTLGQESKKAKKTEKIRKQKQRRARRAKEKAPNSHNG